MFLLGLTIGLIIGWNFIEQPKIVKDKVDKTVAWIKNKFKL